MENVDSVDSAHSVVSVVSVKSVGRARWLCLVLRLSRWPDVKTTLEECRRSAVHLLPNLSSDLKDQALYCLAGQTIGVLE